MLRSLFIVMVGVAALAVAHGARAASMTGAGSTFAAPIYAKWAEGYRAATGNSLNYQSIGSGGGIKQIEANTVDFGATDKPLKAGDLAANGLIQFPTVVGGVVPVINLEGVRPGQMKLTGPILADIYRGVRKYWDDPVIKSYNPSVRLPHERITVVHRSDGSGTTFLFTSYLALVAPHWASSVGASDSVNWPAGVGGKGSEGVSAQVRQTPGSIGYVEYAYAMQNHMTYVDMQNKQGRWVAPTSQNFAAAAAGAKWQSAPGFYLLLLNQPGPTSWPITGGTFILMHGKPGNAESAKAVLAFFDWSYKNGDPGAVQLDYVPLPASVKALVRKSWSAVKDSAGKPLYP